MFSSSVQIKETQFDYNKTVQNITVPGVFYKPQDLFKSNVEKKKREVKLNYIFIDILQS